MNSQQLAHRPCQSEAALAEAGSGISAVVTHCCPGCGDGGGRAGVSLRVFTLIIMLCVCKYGRQLTEIKMHRFSTNNLFTRLLARGRRGAPSGHSPDHRQRCGTCSPPHRMSASSTTPPEPKVSRGRPARRRFVAQIPTSISEDPALLQALEALPANYNFEVPKTIWRLKQMGEGTTVALQMPEGLLLYACVIADILETFAKAECIIMGDVTVWGMLRG